MSGHNRWTKIKRQKEAMGATKGKLFSKVIKEITIAARDGGGDPAANSRLRAAIAAAKEVNLPKENIERAIKRGTGELEGQVYEEITYEGYGPGGVAFLVECVTDNRNRTAGEIRHLFTKGHGNLGETGSVNWLFERKAVMGIPKAHCNEEQAMELALEVGAEDVVDQGEVWELRADAADFHGVFTALEEKGIEAKEPHLAWVPKNTVRVEGEDAKKVLKLVELLEGSDDVQNVFANYEIDDAEIEAAASA
ncbi:MAG: YebC/PmpR family DNA-binding transcriptional regulator [Deltaproteobacteria bacterium]|nr:MAG: YebC/PmpR family DNA-binding transcriptional regulator [Deltaproteobacteria bacterium]